jgi:hypothetical protein
MNRIKRRIAELEPFAMQSAQPGAGKGKYRKPYKQHQIMALLHKLTPNV